ncbi:peptide-methionine (S)-S-oxide reductase MsrA [candidate division WWE3 bacterium]|uniref:Peptide methionine sulfoxide reductase MsrA n=1 Tax=candidate division WWE3 bacterium TaxID=2053526 RepID=A0A955RXH8_UNCKA|nr:peptide-methionine (S)-S-oxide reductase MsrA [candidate division WWE3 bacterium]
MTDKRNIEIATLGGGCFWCTEAVFKKVKGVKKVTSGYSGGEETQISYDAVSTGRTAFAEVVQLEFDPTIIQFQDILRIFFHVHDPTTLNRQGNDIGPQYRSVIFFHNPKQQEVAKSLIEELNQSTVFANDIVTVVEPYISFIEAEEYHQDYFENNPNQGYCRIIIDPKVKKFLKEYKDTGLIKES